MQDGSQLGVAGDQGDGVCSWGLLYNSAAEPARADSRAAAEQLQAHFSRYGRIFMDMLPHCKG